MPAQLAVLPAVDLVGGRELRLTGNGGGNGDGDPLAVALGWQRDGANWIHLVDLDAAYGRGSNAALLAAITARLSCAVQVSGGICDEAALATALAAGAARLVLGTAALASPSWVARAIAALGERVAVGLDVLGSRLVPRGSDTDFGDLLSALDFLEAAGCRRYVVTDKTADGAMTGASLDLLRRVCARTSRPVIASGGIAGLADLRALLALACPAPGAPGVEGVIVGKALYAGQFTLREALAAVAG
jgi:1-(5-phosphoribosyl)-5-[(5-phosphoribosylamino)methylideneamino] imidazole-4-carboxamide isomerase/N-(5'phosphoribosyl)anthranilate isomerase